MDVSPKLRRSLFKRNRTGYVDLSVEKSAIPEYQEQIAIAAILFDMDEKLAATEAKLSKTREIKQGMMQELLTGRVRPIKKGKP